MEKMVDSTSKAAMSKSIFWFTKNMVNEHGRSSHFEAIDMENRDYKTLSYITHIVQNSKCYSIKRKQDRF